MNIKGLKAFSRIMATGTLSAAAKSMHISESALSRQLSLLEAELGLTLFSREKRRLVATSEGEAFYREANRILESLDQIPEIVSEIRRSPQRRARIIVMPRVSNSVAVPAVAEYLDAYPDMDITVEVQPRRMLERWIASQQFDLGLGALPPHHASIASEKICAVPVVAVLHPSHRLANAKSIHLDELKEDRFILMPPTTLIGSQVSRIFANAGFQPKAKLHVSQTLTSCDFVAAGYGVAVTDAMIPSTFGKTVRMVRVEPGAMLDFGIMYPRETGRPEVLSPLIDLVRKHADRYVASLPLD